MAAEDAAPPDTGSIDLTEMNRLAAEISPQVARSGVDLIYQNMISEWLVDPHELAVAPGLEVGVGQRLGGGRRGREQACPTPTPTTVCRCVSPVPGWCPVPRADGAATEPTRALRTKRTR